MKAILDKDFYCSAGCYKNGICTALECAKFKCEHKTIYGAACGCCHRKHPTPEQFKEEYGKEYPDDGAVYVYTNNFGNGWYVTDYRTAKRLPAKALIVCACAPFGEPDKDWRPQEK